MANNDEFSAKVIQRKKDCASIATRAGDRISRILTVGLNVPVRWSVESVHNLAERNLKGDPNAIMLKVAVSHDYIDLKREEMHGVALKAHELETLQRLQDVVTKDIERETKILLEKIQSKEHETPLFSVTLRLVLHMYALLDHPPLLGGFAVCEY